MLLSPREKAIRRRKLVQASHSHQTERHIVSWWLFPHTSDFLSGAPCPFHDLVWFVSLQLSSRKRLKDMQENTNSFRAMYDEVYIMSFSGYTVSSFPPFIRFLGFFPNDALSGEAPCSSVGKANLHMWFTRMVLVSGYAHAWCFEKPLSYIATGVYFEAQRLRTFTVVQTNKLPSCEYEVLVPIFWDQWFVSVTLAAHESPVTMSTWWNKTSVERIHDFIAAGYAGPSFYIILSLSSWCRGDASSSLPRFLAFLR